MVGDDELAGHGNIVIISNKRATFKRFEITSPLTKWVLTLPINYPIIYS